MSWDCAVVKEGKEKRKRREKRNKFKDRGVEFVSILPLAFNPVCSLNVPVWFAISPPSPTYSFTLGHSHNPPFPYSFFRLLIHSSFHSLLAHALNHSFFSLLTIFSSVPYTLFGLIGVPLAFFSSTSPNTSSRCSPSSSYKRVKDRLTY